MCGAAAWWCASFVCVCVLIGSFLLVGLLLACIGGFPCLFLPLSLLPSQWKVHHTRYQYQTSLSSTILYYLYLLLFNSICTN